MYIKSFKSKNFIEKISPSFQNIGLSPIVEISENAADLASSFKQRAGYDFVYFQRGEIDFEPPENLTAALARAMQDPNLRRKTSFYPKSGGEPDCKDALIRHYARRGIHHLDRNNVVITNGGQQGLELIFNLFRGRRVVAFGPIWSCILDNIAPYTDAEIVLSPFKQESGWLTIDFDHLTQLFKKGCTLLYLNNPSNPTGKVFSRDELAQINALCKRYDVFILADEAYKDMVFDGKKHVSMAEFDGDHIVVSGTASKTYAATGWRFGWLLSQNKDITARFTTRGNYSETAGVCTPIQYAFSQVLDDDATEAWIAANVDEYQRRRDVIYQALFKIFGSTLYKPEGALYFMPDFNQFIPGHILEPDAYLLSLFLDNGFAIVPGGAFGGKDYQGQLRLSYSALNAEELESAMERFVGLIKTMGD